MKKDTTVHKHPEATARQGLGRTGERLAAEALMSKGYRILERNFRCRHGEIDRCRLRTSMILSLWRLKLVEAFPSACLRMRLPWRKQRKLMEVASFYLEQHECADRSWRIDVVAVQFSASGKLEEIRIYEHAVTDIG